MSRGFTLVELLVALFITAIMFSMGYAAIDQALTGRKAVEIQAARLLAVQRTIRTLEQDIELLAPRPVRNPVDSGYQAALVANPTAVTNIGSGSATAAAPSSLTVQATALLSLTRGGWSNPAGLPRTELQRVSYLIEDGKLVRYHLPVLDAVGATPAVRRELLDNVTSISFRYMDAGHRWSDTWQGNASTANGGAPSQSLRFRPVAVEITLTLKDWGALLRIVEVAG
jgi:general secretion pathway protein J